MATMDRVYRRVERVKPEPKFVKWPPTFFQFLCYHRVLGGPLGKVAKFCVTDTNCWPTKARSRDGVWQHILNKHNDPPPFTPFDLHEAWRLYYEFVASKKQIPARNIPAGYYYILRYITLSEAGFAKFEDLMNPQLRPNACLDASAVVEAAIRAYHELVLGGHRRDALKAASNGEHKHRSPHVEVV